MINIVNRVEWLTTGSSKDRVDVGIAILIDSGPEQQNVDEYVDRQKYQIDVVVAHVRQSQLVRTQSSDFSPDGGWRLFRLWRH